jgi:hypothetical protein
MKLNRTAYLIGATLLVVAAGLGAPQAQPAQRSCSR